MPIAAITRDQVREAAQVASIALGDEQLDQFTQQLKARLEDIDKLFEVDVESVEPLYHIVEMQNVLREDVIESPLELEQVFQNTDLRDGPFFKVPKVFDNA